MAHPQASRRPGRWRLLFGLLFLFFALVAVAFYGWTQSARYPAHGDGVAAAARAELRSGWLVYPALSAGPAAGVGVVLYPGGLVDAAAYAPLAEALSAEGALAVVVPMPLELAVFGIDRALAVVEAFPEVGEWFLVGHSLGGAMAAELIGRNPERFAGLALLASYPASNRDLSSLSLPVLSVVATRDGVTDRQVVLDSFARLPAGARLLEIEGGNHAGFGDYGPQNGDGSATISAAEQQRQVVAALIELIQSRR